MRASIFVNNRYFHYISIEFSLAGVLHVTKFWLRSLKEWFSCCRLIHVVFTVTGKSRYFQSFKKLVFWWRRWNSWKNLLHRASGKINRWQKLKHVAIKWNQLHFILGIHSYSLNPMWRETWYVFPIAKYSTTVFVSYAPVIPHSHIATLNNFLQNIFLQLVISQTDSFLKATFIFKVEKN